MKTKTTALIVGSALTTIIYGSYLLYKHYLKKAEEFEKQEKEELEELGIDLEELDKDVQKVVETTKDVEGLSDLSVPQQVVKLLWASTIWEDEDLDWKSVKESKHNLMNSVHVVFRENKEFNATEVGFFIEVGPITSSERNRGLDYRDYSNYLLHLGQNFWAKHRVECARPKFIESVGLYSKLSKKKNGNVVLRYTEIPENVLKSRSKYGDRLDGLYRYYSDAKREEEENKISILPDGVKDIHLFIGIWFRLESPDRTYGGMTVKQILQFLEAMIIEDDYIIEKSNNSRVELGPIVIHQSERLEFALDRNLKSVPIDSI